MNTITKLLLLLCLVPVMALAQGGPNANMGANSGGYGPIARPQSDNEALRRILYGQQNGIITVISKPTAAAQMVTGQVTTSTTAGTFVIARATRRTVLLKNLDTTIKVYYGPATVTTGNGMELKPGESREVGTVGLIQVIAASGTPIVAYEDEYD